MSSKIEELRRRFQGQPSKEEEARVGSVPGEAGKSAEPASETARPRLTRISGPPVQASAMADAVAKIFDQTRGFKPAFDDLVGAIDVLDRLGETTARSFGPLQAFQAHLVYLVACFEPVQTFQESLRQLAQNFAPARPLHDEMARLTDSLQTEIATLTRMLEPAKDFRERILGLARSFNQVNELLDELAELQAALAAGQAAAPKQSAASSARDDLIKAVEQGVVRSDFGEDR
jgi:methyl-accepting chemotaxis protein